MGTPDSLGRSLTVYLRPRQLVVLALGIAQGAPFALIAGTLTYWLSRVGVDKSTVGLFFLTGLSYSLKPVWSPLIDRVRLPFFGRKFGQRRSWLFLLQSLLIVAIIALGHSNPGERIGLAAVLAALIGFLSASQDIVIDAYRIEILEDDEQGAGAASIQFGWRLGAWLCGGVTLGIAGVWGYMAAYTVSAFFILPGAVAAVLWGEPRPVETPEASRLRQGAEAFIAARKLRGWTAEWVAWLQMAVVAPFVEFMKRPGWWLILIFILLFKFGDAVAANQTSPLLVELGFSELETALGVKTAGLPPLFVGIALGGSLYFIAGAYRSLLITGALMMLTNLMFVGLAAAGHSMPMLMATIAFENFASGLGGTAVVAYLSGMCNRSFTATQYALLSAVTLIPRSLFASFSGFLAEVVDWETFFLISTVVALPGILMLVAMRRIAFTADGMPRLRHEADSREAAEL